MKRFLTCLLILTLCASCASATILPPTGVDEDFLAWTGIECTPGIVLCESLSIYDERGDQGGKKVSARYYSKDGDPMPVIENWDGWAKVYYADGTQTGWVRSNYLLMDPAWYLCDDQVQVYAYPDTMSPCVALLGTGDTLPIITQYDTEYEGWVCVSLRGAAGWIRRTPKDTVNETWFRPEMLSDLAYAQIILKGEEPLGCTDPETLAALSELLIHAEDRGGMVSGCPFTAELYLETAQGKIITLQLATDSCCVYRVDGRDYAYARNLIVPGEDASPGNETLFGLFGVNPSPMWE